MSNTNKRPGMKTRGRVIAGGASIVAVAAIVAGLWAFASTTATPGPSPTATVTFDPAAVEIGAERLSTALAAHVAEVERVAAEATAAQAEAERVAAEQALAAELAAQAEADRVAAEQAAREVVEAPAPVAPAAPSGPTRCPAGTTAGQVDGNGNESLCQTPCSEWIDTDGDGNAETCGRP